MSALLITVIFWLDFLDNPTFIRHLLLNHDIVVNIYAITLQFLYNLRFNSSYDFMNVF